MIPEADLPKYLAGVQRTGFVLENDVATAFKRKGWTVISNKYYLDDVEEKAREIDLLVYKTDQAKYFRVCTTVLVSCKKSDDRVWALLTRPPDLANRNYNWQPLHVWTNDKAVEYQMGVPDASASYHAGVVAQGVLDCLAPPTGDVFAFQELTRVTGEVKNDANIFDSVSSLMKAQAYELGALPSRRKEPAVYQFNLLSVVDTDLLRVRFDAGIPTAESITSEHFFARYIVRKKETAARIRFVRPSVLEDAIDDYGRLHAANFKLLGILNDEFYESVAMDPAKRKVFMPEFRDHIVWAINYALDKEGIATVQEHQIGLNWDNFDRELSVQIVTNPQAITALTENNLACSVVDAALMKLYRFGGKWKFTDDLPF